MTGPHEIEARRAWLDALPRVRALANAVREGRALDLIEASAVAGVVIRLKAAFPVRRPHAIDAADAFLKLARSAAGNAWPPSTAAFLEQGAHALERLIVEDGHALAAFGRRVLGGDD